MELPIISITIAVVCILFFFFLFQNLFKWVFRGFFVFGVVKLLTSLKDRGEAKIEALKQEFKGD